MNYINVGIVLSKYCNWDPVTNIYSYKKAKITYEMNNNHKERPIYIRIENRNTIYGRDISLDMIDDYLLSILYNFVK